jgi:uncharacterized protein
MQHVVISHAWGATPEMNWYPAAQQRLSNPARRVETVALPEPNTPRLAPWRDALAHAIAGHDPASTVLVGHSLGGAALLHLLAAAEQATPFAGLVLVAVNAHDIGATEVAEFFHTPLDYARIRRNLRQSVTIYAPDDRILAPDPLIHGRAFLEQLGAAMLVLPSGGHFAYFDGVEDIPALEPVVTTLFAATPVAEQR